MAVTQLSDVIIPEVYLSYTAVDSPELTAFYDSGVMVRNAAIDGAFTAGGTLCHLPFWADLDSSVEPNYSTDDPTDEATPNAVTTGQMAARIAQINQGYGAADLVGELAGSNPMQRIRDRFGKYWSRQLQRRLLAVCKGVLAKNVASDSSDMVNDASVADVVNITDANLFARGGFTSALFTLGDQFGKITAIAVHSIVYKRMVDDDQVTIVYPATPDPNLPVGIQGTPYYLGKRVIIDDSMPVAAATGCYKYTSILFGAGAIGFGEQLPNVPVEVYRRPDQGNGGGVETLWERKSWILHPFGHRWLEGSVGGQSPTLAELALSANWSRVVARKNVPLAFLITNG